MAKVTQHPITDIDDVHGFFRTGTVKGVTTWSETHVSSHSSGGGGYIGPYGGHINAPTVSVSSSVTEMNRFFLDYGNDNEEEIKLTGGKFAVRDGHIVSVIRVGPKGENWGYNIAFYNHSTKTEYAPESWLGWPLRKKPSIKSLFLVLALTWIGALVLMRDGTTASILALAAFGVAIHSYRKNSGEYRRLIEAVRARRQLEIDAANAAYSASKTKDDNKVIEISREKRA